MQTSTNRQNNLYAGWKIYHSIFNSGLSFRYPPNWYFPTATLTRLGPPNRFGGNENDSVLYSAKPTTKLGKYAAVSTNVFMCVSFDEYTGKGWFSNKINLGTPLSSQQITVNGEKLELGTFKGKTPMQDQLILYKPANAQSGSYFIHTNNGYVVYVSAQFNCQQGGFPPGTNLYQNFNKMPQTAVAKSIIESIKF
jgi:hypothetical protein